MKNKLVFSLITVFFLALSLDSGVSAQDRGRFNDKMKSQKIAYLTEYLSLTEQEAIKFWPIYNEREKYFMASRERHNSLDVDAKSLNKQEAKQVIDKRLAILKQEYETERQFMERFQKVIPTTKVALMLEADEKFMHQMIQSVKKEFKDRRGID